MNKFMLGVTVATAAVFGAANTYAQTLYTTTTTVPVAPATTVAVPAGTAVVPAGTTVVPVVPATVVPAGTIYYTPPGMVTGAPMTLGQMIGMRLNGEEDVSEFKAALDNSMMTSNFDPDKGYTVFAPINRQFEAGKHPIESYVVNDRIGLAVMHGNHDTVRAINGNTIRINRVNNSVFVNDQRVNEVIKNPEGTIYVVGGWNNAPSL